MLQDLTYETFRPHLNETFRIEAEESRLDLELTEVEAFDAADEDRRRAFSLVFYGPEQPFLAQAIHRLEHATLGSLDLFLVPIGQKNGGFLYQVIFN